MKQTISNFFNGWRAPEFFLAFLFTIAPLYYHPNIGGEGLRIPNSTTIWFAAFIFIAYSLYKVVRSEKFQLPRYFSYITAFPLLIILSGIISGVEQPLLWLFRILFIVGGLAFLFSLFQHQFTQGRWDKLLLLIAFTMMIHAGVGLLQIYLKGDMTFFLPKSITGQPSGFFQQINNQATYLVTTIALLFYLASRPVLFKCSVYIVVATVLTILASSFIVGISGSRVGLLTLIISVPLILFGRKQQLLKNKTLLKAISISLLIGVSAGLITSTGSVIDKMEAVQSGYSGSMRLGIYKISLDLIAEKPWFGHGITSFPQVFQNARPLFYEQYPEAILPNVFVAHPHNELLLWAVESGTLGLVGLLACFIALGMSLIKLGASRALGQLALVLPLLIHTQVEIPMYVSALSWFTLLLLMAYSFRYQLRTKQNQLSLFARKTALMFIAIVTLLTGCFLIHTARSNWDFWAFYQNQSERENPFPYALKNPALAGEAEWMNMSRIFYASMSLGLNENVKFFQQWGQDKLRVRPDIALYQKLAQSYIYSKDMDNYCRLIAQAGGIYPKEEAFMNSERECKD